MLDENLPTYRFRVSSENPLHTLLYYTHNGSEPSTDYLIKRPPPISSHNQYALGLFDIQYSSVLYAEVLVTPEWSQPTLSAAEVRANAGVPIAVPLTPHTFSVSLYNPDQAVQVKHQQGSWSKDSWEFEVPERSFRTPSTSKIDQDAPESRLAELVPKVNFRWKRDGRMSRDMTCYMSGKTVGGKKNKEPDITVALFRGGKTEGAVAIYEPNMRRVDIEDRKGLEVILLLSAEVIRDLYLCPRQDPFNTAGAPSPNVSKANGPPQQVSGAAMSGGAAMAGAGMSGAAMSGAAMSGALGNAKPSSQQPPKNTSPGPDARMRADVDAEKMRRQAMISQQSSREKKLQREQEEIKKMLEREEREEAERQRREQREREKRVNRETEELLKKYGPQPALPPRPPNQPPRPRSVEPSSSSEVRFADQQPQPQQNGGARKKFGNFLQNSPYTGPVASGASGFFGGSSKTEEEKLKKAKKKRSVHF